MDSVTYRVLYDAADSWFPAWPLAAAGLVVAIAGVALARRRPPAGATRFQRVTSGFGTVLVIGGLGWMLVVGLGLFAQHARLRSALRDGDYTVVEGIVHDIAPTGQPHYRGMSWVVESGPTAHWYPYALSRLSAGYRRTGPRTGGLREGVRVRIADVGGYIARLEVER